MGSEGKWVLKEFFRNFLFWSTMHVVFSVYNIGLSLVLTSYHADNSTQKKSQHGVTRNPHITTRESRLRIFVMIHQPWECHHSLYHHRSLHYQTTTRLDPVTSHYLLMAFRQMTSLQRVPCMRTQANMCLTTHTHWQMMNHYNQEITLPDMNPGSTANFHEIQ